jgi:hypothetical protein
VNVTVVLRGHFVHHMTSRLKFRECLLFGNRSVYVKFVSAFDYDLQVLLETYLESELL